MKKRPPEPDSAPEVDEAAELGFVRQLGQMRQALVGSPVVGGLVLLAIAMFVTLVATTYSQIRLNRWNKPFYDAMSRRDLHDFLVQLGVFAVIAGALLILNVSSAGWWRPLRSSCAKAWCGDLLQLWMLPRRAFWLANAGGHMGVNPDQRMHEDARKLCELTADLGTGLLQSAMSVRDIRRRAVGAVERFLVPHRRTWTTRFRDSWCGPPSSTRASARS